jgi:hypothetical protein
MEVRCVITGCNSSLQIQKAPPRIPPRLTLRLECRLPRAQPKVALLPLLRIHPFKPKNALEHVLSGNSSRRVTHP